MFPRNDNNKGSAVYELRYILVRTGADGAEAVRSLSSEVRLSLLENYEFPVRSRGTSEKQARH